MTTAPTTNNGESAAVRQAAFVRLFHTSGVQVSVPLGVGIDPAAVFSELDRWLAAGWKTDAPGLEPGEQKEEIGYVVRKIQESERGDSIRLDLYADHEGMKWSVLTVYLDDDEDIAAFEKAAGVRIQDIPIYSGADKIERGKSRQTDRFVFRLPRPVRAVWKINPKYNAEEAKKVRADNKIYKIPQRLFVRWDVSSPGPGPSPDQGVAVLSNEQITEINDLINELRDEGFDFNYPAFMSWIQSMPGCGPHVTDLKNTPAVCFERITKDLKQNIAAMRSHNSKRVTR